MDTEQVLSFKFVSGLTEIIGLKPKDFVLIRDESYHISDARDDHLFGLFYLARLRVDQITQGLIVCATMRFNQGFHRL